MFKVLVLQALHNLLEEQADYMSKDCLSSLEIKPCLHRPAA